MTEIRFHIRVEQRHISVADRQEVATRVCIGARPAEESPVEDLVSPCGGYHLTANPVDTVLSHNVGGEFSLEAGGLILYSNPFKIRIIIPEVICEDGSCVFASEHGPGIYAGIQVQLSVTCPSPVIVVEEEIFDQVGIP